MKKKLFSASLPAIVFVTGACVLVVEVVATRILSPYYGNTIYAFSSVISVILAALSIGYYFGGKMADKYPSLKVFLGIIALSGVSLLLLQIVSVYALPEMGARLSITTGPLVSSLAFFFLPAVLLGTLSPYAVKLQKVLAPKEGVGSVAGLIFFWSTLGSIVGSLLAGFVLIPHFGVQRIILGCGLVLVIVGFVPLFLLGVSQKKLWGMAVIFALVGSTAVAAQPQPNTLYSQDGLYEKLVVYDGTWQGQPTRFFRQDRSSSGAMYLNSDEPVYDYTKYYRVHEAFTPKLDRALVIGGGIYTVPKALLQHNQQVQVDVAEIEPSLFELAQKYFRLTPSPRLHNHVEDGRRMLSAHDQKYDFIFSDVYHSLYSVPAHFTTQEFFTLAKSRLQPGGVFAANIIGDLSRKPPSLLLAEMKTFQSVFPNSYFFAVEDPQHTATQNIIVVGVNSETSTDLQSAAITAHPDPIIRSLASQRIDPKRFELSAYPLLTDDYSPVEYMSAQLVNRTYGPHPTFDGEEMLATIDQQLRYGPRHLSAPGHAKMQDFLQAEMTTLADKTEVQAWNDGSHLLKNVVARFQPDNPNRIILGTHYDTKKQSDQDPARSNMPVPGANDGSSGVAVLVELARLLATGKIAPAAGIDIVFFDGEEGKEQLQGSDGWQPLGSVYFASKLDEMYPAQKPQEAVVVDMVCDKNLQLKKEPSSLVDASAQVNRFWQIGRRLNPSAFQNAEWDKPISDDHTPLQNAGIPSFLVIDFDYPAFHTPDDTLNKCSAESLATVTETLSDYLTERKY